MPDHCCHCNKSQDKATGTTPAELPDDTFEASYAIDCKREISAEFIKQCLPGNINVKDLKVIPEQKMVGIVSNAAPSLIIEAFQAHGMDAILRGSGKPNSSAVCILEDFGKNGNTTTYTDSQIQGLIRIVQIKDDGDNATMFDISLRGNIPAGEYVVSINESGDISRGLESTGKPFYEFKDRTLQCKVAPTPGLGRGLVSAHAFWGAPVKTWEIIGRSFVVRNLSTGTGLGGIIARSAGAWENDKQVCACSGKTVWEEREDAKRININ